MPRVRRKAKRRKTTQATEGDLDYLRYHFPFFVSDILAPSNNWNDVDQEAAKALWEEYRDQLAYEVPLKRPWAWWAWEAPERRRCLNMVHPFDNPIRTAYLEREGNSPWVEGVSPMYQDPNALYYGKPALIGGFEDENGNKFSEFEAIYEEEHCYLYRLGLFNEEERYLWGEMLSEIKHNTEEGKKHRRVLAQHGIEV